MEKLLKSLVVLFHLTTIRLKLIVGASVFAIPTAILLYYVVSGQNTTIEFSQKEIYGVEVIEKALPVYEFTYQHLHLQLESKRNPAVSSEIPNIQKLIDRSLHQLSMVSEKYENELSLTPDALKSLGFAEFEAGAIKAAWEKLRLSNAKTNEEIIESHQHLLTIMQGYIAYVGDRSNLILDPELHTFYLMDASVVTLPKLVQVLHQGKVMGDTLSNFRINEQSKIQFVGLRSTLANEGIEKLDRNFSIVVKESISMFGTGSRELVDLQMKHNNFIESLREMNSELGKLTETTEKDIDGDKLSGLTLTTLQRINSYYLQTLKTLHYYVTERVDGYKYDRLFALTVSILAILLAYAVMISLATFISKPLAKVTLLAQEIAQGRVDMAKEMLETKTGVFDYLQIVNPETTHRVKDESIKLNLAISAMTLKLEDVLNRIQQAGVEVTSSTNQITSSIRSLEITVTEQASSTSEVSATSLEISKTSEQLAETVGAVTIMAEEASGLAQEGLTNFEHVNAMMFMMSEASIALTDKLEILYQKTANITGVLSTISKLAAQTNLLSLNAAIEAEKAGAHSAGFTVVASEIRKLANQTAVSALEIQTMISEIEETINDGMSYVRNYSESAKDSTNTIQSFARDLNKIIEYTNGLVPGIQTVDQSMNAQVLGAGQISTAMQQLNEAARGTQDSIFDFRTVTQKLNAAVTSLREVLSIFSGK